MWRTLCLNLQTVVKEEKRHGECQKYCPLTENENTAIMSNKYQRIYQATKIRKIVEFHPTAIVIEARVESCREHPP